MPSSFIAAAGVLRVPGQKITCGSAATDSQAFCLGRLPAGRPPSPRSPATPEFSGPHPGSLLQAHPSRGEADGIVDGEGGAEGEAAACAAQISRVRSAQGHRNTRCCGAAARAGQPDLFDSVFNPSRIGRLTTTPSAPCSLWSQNIGQRAIEVGSTMPGMAIRKMVVRLTVSMIAFPL